MSTATEARYYARSASDHDPDWPWWFVADRQQGGLNVTGKLWEQLTGRRAQGGCLTERCFAEVIAGAANERGLQP